ncbi:MAG: enoyl-CoA hydratase/isomerase family protein, partial [Trueperaceae bacterium]|nr:enoyl-CoA hydratase/isomerase family protein [Trueperaceae bacterium]
MKDYFKLSKQDGVLLIGLDQPDSRVNTLSQAALRSFEKVLDIIENDAELKAAVIISRKKDSFIVGADINEFVNFSSKEEVISLIQQGHALFDRLERLSKPVVAAIHGACVGGGLELALACHYRLASEHKRTLFALPEVNLGLLPGLGGTQRLPRLVGLQNGLELILTGKNVYAKPARKMGIVDALIHEAGLEAAALQAAKGLADGSVSRRERKESLQDKLLENTPLNRIVYSKAAETVEKRSKGNYPAPPKIIEVIRTGMEKGLTAGFHAEASAFAELVLTPESKALRHLFFAKNASEKNPLKDQANPVSSLGILGAGLMGSGIAQVSA